MNQIVEPKILKGFRDSLPETETVKKQIIRKLEETFTRFGFDPVDTPALEYASVLLGKGSGETDKQIYRFRDNGGRDVALRFDLTVPFARLIAAHRSELPMPFRRYHIAKVWRGENTQKGRYREFTQCDFDIVGSDSPLNDLDILLLMNESFRVLGIDGVTFHISHRGIFNDFLKKEGIETASADILRTVDKIGKIGEEEVRRLLTELLTAEKAEKVIDFIRPEETNERTLQKLTRFCGGETQNTARLSDLLRMLEAAEVGAKFKINPSITRGLDYYTGIVYETFLNDLPGIIIYRIGSVDGGARRTRSSSGNQNRNSRLGMPSGRTVSRRLPAFDTAAAGSGNRLRTLSRSQKTAETVLLCGNERHRVCRHLRRSRSGIRDCHRKRFNKTGKPR